MLKANMKSIISTYIYFYSISLLVLFTSCGNFEKSYCDYMNLADEKYKAKDHQGSIELYTELLNNSELLEKFTHDNCHTSHLTYNDVEELKASFFESRANAKVRANDLEGAIEDFSNVLKINSNHLGVLASRAEAKFAIQDYQGAKEDIMLLIDKDDNGNMNYRIDTKKMLRECNLGIKNTSTETTSRKSEDKGNYNSEGEKCTQCFGHYRNGFCTQCGTASAERVAESYSKAPNCEFCNGSGYIDAGGIHNRKKICPSCKGNGKQTY